MRIAELHREIDGICSAPSPALAILRDLHSSINAMGGIPRSEYERGRNDAVGMALAFIETKMVEAGHGA